MLEIGLGPQLILTDKPKDPFVQKGWSLESLSCHVNSQRLCVVLVF